jgi:hypothetical protein
VRQAILDETLDCFSLQPATRSAKASAGRASRADGWKSRRIHLRLVMKRIARCLVPVVGLTWLSLHFGCQGPTLVTKPWQSSSGKVEGMLYYLPIGKITIKGEYEKSEQSPTPSPTATATATATPTPTPTPKHASASGGKPNRGGKNNDSGEGSIAISGGQLKITITSRVEADQKAGVYYVTPQTNDIFDDEIQVTVNSKHLLTAGKVTTEDKTAEIVGTIASIAAQAMHAEQFLPAAGATPTPPPQPFYFSFDPANQRDVTFVKGQLRQRGISLTVSPTPAGNILDADTVKQLAEDYGQSGLVFRPAAAYNVQLIYPVDATSGKPRPGQKLYIIKDTEQFILPDRTKVCVMKYDRLRG